MKICEMCGMAIARKYKFCNECSVIASGHVVQQETENKKKTEKMMKYYHSESLIKAITEADKLGMSYGNYIALARSEKNVRRKK